MRMRPSGRKPRSQGTSSPVTTVSTSTGGVAVAQATSDCSSLTTPSGTVNSTRVSGVPHPEALTASSPMNRHTRSWPVPNPAADSRENSRPSASRESLLGSFPRGDRRFEISCMMQGTDAVPWGKRWGRKGANVPIVRCEPLPREVSRHTARSGRGSQLPSRTIWLNETWVSSLIRLRSVIEPPERTTNPWHRTQ